MPIASRPFSPRLRILNLRTAEVSLGEYMARRRKKLPASNTGARSPIGSLKQLRFEAVLQISQPSTERRLTNIQHFRCASKTTVL